MLTTYIFVKCAVMYTLVSGMRTSIASGSGLAHAQTAARLNEEREWALGVW